MDFILGITIVLSAIISLFIIMLFENIGCLCSTKSHFPSREVMTYVFGLVFQRDLGGLNPRNWSGRLVAIGFAITMIIVMTTYTADITASNIIQHEDDGFRGLKDPRILNPTSSFTFGVISDTSTEMLFKDSENKQMQKVWDFIKDYNVENNIDGIEKVYKGEINAYISDELSIEPIVSDMKYCSELTLYKEPRMLNEVVFAYNESFALGEEISQEILKLVGTTTMKDLLKKWRYIPNCKVFNENDSQFDYTYFGGIVFVFGVVLVFCIPIILFENVWTFVKRKWPSSESKSQSIEDS